LDLGLRKYGMNSKRNKIMFGSAIALLLVLNGILFACEWYIFFNPNSDYPYNKFALSILVGNFGALAGMFAALLSTPHGSDDKERLSKVGSTLVTLVTGYVLAKVIDPLVVDTMKTPESIHAVFFSINKAAIILIGSISFLAGFLAFYTLRAYWLNTSGEIQTSNEVQVLLMEIEAKNQLQTNTQNEIQELIKKIKGKSQIQTNVKKMPGNKEENKIDNPTKKT
jgi:hypothetical protein